MAEEGERRNAHWVKTQGGSAGEAGAQRSQDKQNKAASKTYTMTECF